MEDAYFQTLQFTAEVSEKDWRSPALLLSGASVQHFPMFTERERLKNANERRIAMRKFRELR